MVNIGGASLQMIKSYFTQLRKLYDVLCFAAFLKPFWLRIEAPSAKESMATATWNGTVIAQSDATIVVEGNHYFPADSLSREHFRATTTHTTCSWKGVASYYDVVIGEAINKDAAWFYPQPKDPAKNIKDFVAFWKGVKVTP